MRTSYRRLLSSAAFLLPRSASGLVHQLSIGNTRKRSAHLQLSKTTRLFVDKRRFSERSARQEERIYQLEQLQTKSPSQQAELEGLRQKAFVEQYDPASFTDSHLKFKQQHNQVFGDLCRYCNVSENNNNNRNAFFLDGPDAGTASVLTSSHHNIPVECCFVANRHESTCNSLLEWGLPETNIAHASAQDALSSDGTFGSIPFAAFYFDGCGGHAPILIDMLTAARDPRPNRILCEPPIAIGISIVGGNPRDVVNKELIIARALVELSKKRGLRVAHVLDDCEQFGISNREIQKVEGNTLTTWFVLEKR